MNKDKINKEKKEKAKNIAFKILHGVSYALSTCFIATCIVACASSGAKNKSNNSPKSLIQYRIDGESESESVSDSVIESESVSYPIYDDINYEITLSTYQLNNYVWSNFAELLTDDYENIESIISFFIYGPSNYIYETSDINSENDLYYISYSNEDLPTEYIDFNSENNLLKFVLFDGSQNVVADFNGDLLFKSTELYYDDIKQAIQLDAIANHELPTSDIFTAISDTITNFVIALSSGITAIVGLFWNSTSSALTPLGVLTTIVVGVALVYFVFRLIIGLIRLRG